MNLFFFFFTFHGRLGYWRRKKETYRRVWRLEKHHLAARKAHVLKRNALRLFLYSCVCVYVCYLLSRVRFFAAPWTVAHQAPLFIEFSRQYWSGLPFPSPGDHPDPGIELRSPALQADSLPTEPPGKPCEYSCEYCILLFEWAPINFNAPNVLIYAVRTYY